MRFLALGLIILAVLGSAAYLDLRGRSQTTLAISVSFPTPTPTAPINSLQRRIDDLWKEKCLADIEPTAVSFARSRLFATPTPPVPFVSC